jgi:hypothetical protein
MRLTALHFVPPMRAPYHDICPCVAALLIDGKERHKYPLPIFVDNR